MNERAFVHLFVNFTFITSENGLSVHALSLFRKSVLNYPWDPPKPTPRSHNWNIFKRTFGQILNERSKLLLFVYISGWCNHPIEKTQYHSIYINFHKMSTICSFTRTHLLVRADHMPFLASNVYMLYHQRLRLLPINYSRNYFGCASFLFVFSSLFLFLDFCYRNTIWSAEHMH